ncbi:hypothetical protein [Niabella aurantiaca]|uniref:hypothetical protein n=1 Tax=Niabella aurantiaca TaxID=379900 RepID=UPI00037033C8|nr:hypothetical protein [Niabella aurantiaca]
MKPPFRIFYRSLIKPFYRENAGTFVFVFTMFFFIVGTVDGAGLFKYHYGLIRALLSINAFLAAVLLLWILYARKCAVFIARCLRQPPYQFMAIFRNLPRHQQYLLFFITDFVLLLPQIFYMLLVITEGFCLRLFPSTGIVLCALIIFCSLLPAWHVYALNHPERSTGRIRFFRMYRVSLYPQILIRAVLQTQKLVWLGIKLFTGTLLYFMAVNNRLTNDDIQLTFLLFSFGVLANGVFINRLRMFEEHYLSFYRGLPVSLANRFLQYALVSLFLVLPEAGLLCFLAPAHISAGNALAFGFYAFSTLLLLTAISFVKLTTLKHSIRILLLIFFTGYFLMMAAGVALISILYACGAIVLFRAAYYRCGTGIS